MTRLSALAIAILMFLASNAEAHDPTDLWPSLPFCHKPDADEWPDCRVYDGDLPAKADTGPWTACEDGRTVDGFNCVYADEVERADLVRYCHERFEVGECVRIERPKPLPWWKRETHFGSAKVTPYRDGWWHRNNNHHRSDGERNQPADRSNDQARAEPQPTEPPAREPERSEPPARETPECD